MMAFLGEDFDDITVHDFVTQSDHLAVNFLRRRTGGRLGVDEISEIHGSGAAGKLEHAAFGP